MKLKTKLYEYLLFPISKKEFLIVLEQIVMAVQKLQANSMSISNLVMEVYKVYINRNTKEMQFLYIPISDCPVSDIAEFIESSFVESFNEMFPMLTESFPETIQGIESMMTGAADVLEQADSEVAKAFKG